MTPQELLRIARNINPQKLETDPQATLEDAYVVWEAVRLADMEKGSAPNYLPPKGRPEPWEGKPSTTVDHLRIYLKNNKDTSVYKICKKLKISSGSMYRWLDGRSGPNAKSVARIEGFLHDVGYYE
jgi:hypothetical protein